MRTGRFGTRISLLATAVGFLFISLSFSYATGTEPGPEPSPTSSDPFAIEKVLHMGILGDEGDMDALLTVTRMSPDSEEPLHATFRLLYDTDNDEETGRVIAGFTGIDREIRVEFSKEAPTAPAAVTGVVVDHLQEGNPTPFTAQPQALPALPSSCSLCPDIEPQILFKIRKSSLNLTAPYPPFYVIFQDDVGVLATIFFIFDQGKEENLPRLTFFEWEPHPGQVVPFILSGLEPGSPFELFVGQDELVFSKMLDSTGGFAGSFIFPDLPPGGYFVTARDASGQLTFVQVKVPDSADPAP